MRTKQLSLSLSKGNQGGRRSIAEEKKFAKVTVNDRIPFREYRKNDVNDRES